MDCLQLRLARFNPKFTVLIIGLGLIAAVLEEVGLSLILPIVEIIQAEDLVAEADGLMAAFVICYLIYACDWIVYRSA